jgi:hypothetical protein
MMARKLTYKMLFLIMLTLTYPICANAQIYDIGPGKEFSHLSDFDWDSLDPGNIVKIYSSDVPYREKLVIRRSGTKQKPIVIKGIPNSSGKMPVIDGENAISFQELCELRKSGRGLIMLGDCGPANDIVIEDLELRNANNINNFLMGKELVGYANNAAGIFVNRGINVKVKNCIIHSCCMGIITSYYPDVDDFVLPSSHIYDNGDFTGKRWGHNVYLCARRQLIQFNHFGDLHSDGNNIKDRSQQTVIRYNWIEGGMSHQIDLVEHNEYQKANAFVYGNVILQGRKVKNPKMVFYGGDVGGSRGGCLYFFNNTMHAKKGVPHAFIVINKPDCMAFLQNNVMLGGKKVWIGKGAVTGSNNLLSFGADTSRLLMSFWGGRSRLLGAAPFPTFQGEGLH